MSEGEPQPGGIEAGMSMRGGGSGSAFIRMIVGTQALTCDMDAGALRQLGKTLLALADQMAPQIPTPKAMSGEWGGKT